MSGTTDPQNTPKDETFQVFGLRRRSSISHLINFKGQKPQEALCSYSTETLGYIHKVSGLSQWIDERKKELQKIKHIRHRADNIKLDFGHWEYYTIPRRKKGQREEQREELREELRNELADVLKDTLDGFEKLNVVMSTVEKLALTSCYVFMEDRHLVFRLPAGVCLKHTRDVIIRAQVISPDVFFFKKEAVSESFTPRLRNLEVMLEQLDEYIQKTQWIYDSLEISHFPLERSPKTEVELCEELPDVDIERMLTRIQQLDAFRMHHSLFKHFLDEFKNRQPRMLQFLKDLEEVAVKLDSIDKGAKIFSVVGSSVGAVGGALTIAGIALSPVKVGASLALTVAGIGLGVTSGASTAVTTITEFGLNKRHQKRAEEIFKNFMEDLQSLQDCLKVIRQQVTKLETSQDGGGEGSGRRPSVDGDIQKALGSPGKAAGSLLEIEKLLGQAAMKGSIALSKSARGGLIGLNALFIGIDLYYIYKDSMSLAEGIESEMSKSIRAKAAQLSSVMGSFQETYDYFTSLLKKPFYPNK